MAEKPRSLLQSSKHSVTTLNKKLIIALVALLFIIFLAIVIDSFSPPEPSIPTESTPTGSHSGASPASELSNLPGSYSDGTQINKMLNREVDGLSPQALEKINQIQSKEQALEQQMAQLSQQGSASTPFSEEAASSSIFFAGGAPSKNLSAPSTNKETDKKESSKTNGKDSNNSYNPYAQQNNQTQKLDFLSSQPSKEIYNNNTVQYPPSQYILQAGSVIPGNLITTIVTNLPGVVTASVGQNVYDSITGKYLLIPRGSKLIGQYNSNVSFGQSQVQIKFTRLIRPDGSSIVLPSESGIDKMGQTGLADDVNNHWGKIIGSATLSALFNLPAVVATNQMNNQPSVCTTDGCTSPSVSRVVGVSALQSAGNSASQVGDQLATQSLNIQPEITIHSGFQFSIMVTKDIILPPYGEPAPR